MQAICEHNYARLIRLLPDIDVEDQSYRFVVGNNDHYSISILETARYTTTLSVERTDDAIPGYLKPAMTVRMYHDARMAEVLASQNTGAIAASYRYPNAKMRMPDEKHRVNAFLAEWLQFCVNLRPVPLSEM